MIPPEFEYLTVEFEPEGNPRIPFEAGQVLENDGDLDSAATMYNRAFGLAPEDSEIRAAFADLLNRLEVKEHGLTWRYIPGGVFLMGDNFGEPDERPWHPVWLKPYWVTDTCISWTDYFRIMEWSLEDRYAEKNYPAEEAFEFLRRDEYLLHWVERMASLYSIGRSDNMHETRANNQTGDEENRFDLKPYTAVPYQMAELLCHKLSGFPIANPRRRGLGKRISDLLGLANSETTPPSASVTYHLPTEAQWEKAARGGLMGAPFPWGWEPATPEQIDCDRFYDFGIKPMRSLSANAYGLFGMSGGVWEWTSDLYDREFYQQSPREDPTGPTTGEERVIRGGSWADCPDVCTVSFRNSMNADLSARRRYSHLTPTIGFRLVRTVG